MHLTDGRVIGAAAIAVGVAIAGVLLATRSPESRRAVVAVPDVRAAAFEAPHEGFARFPDEATRARVHDRIVAARAEAKRAQVGKPILLCDGPCPTTPRDDDSAMQRGLEAATDELFGQVRACVRRETNATGRYELQTRVVGVFGIAALIEHAAVVRCIEGTCVDLASSACVDQLFRSIVLPSVDGEYVACRRLPDHE